MVSKKKKILIYYTAFSEQIGGSEILPLILLEILSDKYDVTLLTRNQVNWDLQNHNYERNVNSLLFHIKYSSPQNYILKFLDRFIHFYEAYQIKKLGPLYDICISCSNMVDFGRPGIHFIYMMNFDFEFENFILKIQRNSQISLPHKMLRFILDRFVRPCIVQERSSRELLSNPSEIILPNSLYVKQKVEDFFHHKIADAFYPPTMDVKIAETRNKSILDVISIGRISPEKNYEMIIDIIRRVRQNTGMNIKLHIAGILSATAYSQKLKALAQKEPWIILEGGVFGQRKKELLMSSAIAVHAREAEEFGIVITEYIKTGVVPIVPRQGGAAEIVNEPQLTFSCVDEGAAILANLLKKPELLIKMQKKLRKRAEYFSEEAFRKRLHELLKKYGL